MPVRSRKTIEIDQGVADLSEKITADVLEATEFPSLAAKYQVQGVPKTIINEKVYIEGGAPKSVLIQKIEKLIYDFDTLESRLLLMVLGFCI